MMVNYNNLLISLTDETLEPSSVPIGEMEFQSEAG